jgi:hypothetical protein
VGIRRGGTWPGQALVFSPPRPQGLVGVREAGPDESASRLLIVLVIMTMQLGRINAFNEMCAGFKVK